MERTAATRKAATTTDQKQGKRARAARPAAATQRSLDVGSRSSAPAAASAAAPPPATAAPAKKPRQAFDHMHDVKIKVENMHDRTKKLVRRIGAWNLPQMSGVIGALEMADSALENVRNEFGKLPAGLQPQRGKARGAVAVEFKVDMVVAIAEKRRANYEGLAASDMEKLTVKFVGPKKLRCRAPSGVEVFVGKRDVKPVEQP